MENPRVSEEEIKEYFARCLNYSPGYGGLSCNNFNSVKEESGDNLCTRCGNIEEKSFEGFKKRIEAYQTGKRRAKNTLMKNASNIKVLMPKKAHDALLKTLDGLNLSGESYREAYLNGLVELLGGNLVKVFDTNNEDSGYSTATKHSMRATARVALRAYGLTEFLEQDPFNRDAGEIIKQIFFVTEDEFKMLIDAPPLSSEWNDYEWLRDRAGYCIMYHTGATVSELVRLNCRDLNLEECFVRLTNKDRRTRTVPINKEDKEKLIRFTEEYIETFNKHPEYIPIDRGILLRNRDGKPMTVRSVGRNLKRDAKKAGLERKDSIEPTWFRYAFANKHKGKGPERLAELLGIQKQGARNLIAMLR